MYDKRRRQTALLKIVRGHAVANQNEMVARLHESRIPATQASVSRDVRELGLVKVNGRYVPAARVSSGRPEGPLTELITEIEPVGANLIVVRTPNGAASAAAVEIDSAASTAIVGTVAGDDTVFVAVRSRSAQGQALALLSAWARQPDAIRFLPSYEFSLRTTNMKPRAVLAYSGGLDTTYCALWLREQGYDVHTVTVQTGGFDADELGQIEARARAAGVAEHRTIDARSELCNDFLRYLIFANALRGDVYPLCVSAERVAQARRCAQYAVTIGADALAHGSTGAGNDQVRFDIGFRVHAPHVTVLAPIREQALSREDETAYLRARGIEIPSKITRYSINRGLWGVTIGGAETHRSDGVLPEDAWVLTAPPDQRPSAPEDVTLGFERGVPTTLDGQAFDMVRLIESLNERAGRHGVGRGMHVGDTILGIKGRVAFEAPAAAVLIAAHRELEKLVLSRQQLLWKRTLGDLYGSLLHEARFFDPLVRDLEAFLTSSQQRVTGRVTVRLHAGQALVLGATSPYSLMNPEVARYGESSTLWTGAEAAAFAKIYGLQDWLVARVATRNEGGHAPLA